MSTLTMLPIIKNLNRFKVVYVAESEDGTQKVRELELYGTSKEEVMARVIGLVTHIELIIEPTIRRTLDGR